MSSYDFTFKILLLGDASIDKTSFTKRYCYNIFNPSERLTIGVDFHVKTIDLHGKKIKLQIWDVGGEERFRFLLPTYCLGANAAFLLYDVTRSKTLDNISEWTNIVHQKSGDIPIMLVGAKIDLEETQREVPREYGIEVADKNNMASFIEVSAKTGENVEKAFEALTRLMLGGFKPRKLGVKPAIIDEIGLEQVKESIQRYINQKSKTNKQITRARTIKAIKKSLKLAEKDQSWDDDIWAFTISLSKSICKRITPKTIYFNPKFLRLIGDNDIKRKRILELEKEKQREQSLSRETYKLLQEGTQLKDKTPKEKVVTSIRSFMNQNLEQWLETLKGLKKGCEEIIKFLKDKNEQYYYHISFEQWKYLLRISSELLEEFKENSSSFYKMSDDTKGKLYNLFEIFIPCREILSNGSFGKNIRVTFEEYLKILKLEKEIHK